MPGIETWQCRGVNSWECSKCGVEKPLTEFVVKRHSARAKDKQDHVTRECVECKRAAGRRRYKEDPESAKARNSEYRKHNRPKINAQVRRRRQTDAEFAERVRAYNRAENMTPERLERRRKRQRDYMRRPEVRARRRDWYAQYREILRQAEASSLREAKVHTKRQEQFAIKASLSQDEMELLELAAPIPTPVAKGYLDHMLKIAVADIPADHKDGSRTPGIGRVALWTGIPQRRLYEINEGISQSVPIEVMDKLALWGDWTLDEFTDAAREWAYLTNDPWPIGYRGVQAALARIRAEDVQLLAA